MKLVKLFVGKTSELEMLEKQINDWLRGESAGGMDNLSLVQEGMPSQTGPRDMNFPHTIVAIGYYPRQA